ncbi:MAG: hypothetical protein KDJ52_06520 [Anaerolineae bacterium]|nr:hypothetical protein [Anaerolineae bacterium]
MMKRILSLVILSLTLFSFGARPTWADEVTLTQTAPAGVMAQYPLEIHNETGTDHTYQLTVTGLPDTLAVTFTQGGPVLDQVTVPANSYGQVTLRIDVPIDTLVGHYAGQFTATRDDGTALAHPLSLNVENTYALKITGQTTNANVFSGQEFTFETTAANTGAAPVTHLALQVDAPTKWLVQLDPPQVDSLEPGQTVSLNARVLVPASQVSIDQPLPLSVTSSETTSPTSELMVRVQKSPDYLIASGVVIALAVGGVFVYFKIKGRR